MRKRGSRKHKIGISRRPRRRLSSVRRGAGSDVQILIYRKVFFARLVERFLHHYFAATRFFFHRAGRTAGRTEWFRFSFLERWMARAWIVFFSWWPQVLVLALIWYSLVEYDRNFWDKALTLLNPGRGFTPPFTLDIPEHRNRGKNNYSQPEKKHHHR